LNSNPRCAVVSRGADGLEKNTSKAHVLVGFDGFVDEIIHVVDRRHDTDTFDTIPSMSEFAERIGAAAGLSANIEMVPVQVKLGGNGPILANALMKQGHPVHYMGSIGAPDIHPVFKTFATSCASVVSVTDPAHTDALEFNDGKLMLGKMHTLSEINWSNLTQLVPAEDMQKLLSNVSMIACTNWTMLPNMNSILVGLKDALAKNTVRPKLFVDLADPQKRSEKDIREVLTLIGDLQSAADVVLGLNENESVQIAKVLLGRRIDDLTTRAAEIRNTLSLDMVMIHPLAGAGVASATGQHFIEGPFCKDPKLTTGAGDNFNAGFCMGLLSGLDPEACLATGVCNSGFYVRNMRSPSRDEIILFMREWAQAGCPSIY
jgi:sugar/nucleoside kinase (ribokinase family)